MPFPKSPRVIYEKNPLERVICQLRFPPILKIDLELLAEFQDALRKKFPLFVEESAPTIELPLEFQRLPFEIISSLSPEGHKRYTFKTADEKWVINLERNFIAITAREYARWEEFREYFESPLKVLKEIYDPAFFSRTGLRYRNIIRKSVLGLEDVSWSELLNPKIAGIIKDKDLSQFIHNINGKIEIVLADGDSLVRINHGLVRHNSSGEICYLIDNDFFTEQNIEVDHALEKISYFNQRSGNLFRWCITEKLHTAMGPTVV